MAVDREGRGRLGRLVEGISSSLAGNRAGGRPEAGRTRLSAEQLVVTCLVVGVILVIAVIMAIVLETSGPG